MPKQTVSAMVQGGKATAGPPLGPQLGPMGVKIPDVIAKINEKTRDLAGMDVPIKVIVHENKSFEVEVGTPPVAALIKKELKIEKGSKEAGKLRAGDLTQEQVKKISKMKFGSDQNPFLNQVIGTARSMGITVGRGAVTQEEIAAYEATKKAEEEAALAAQAAKAAATAAAPAAGEKKEEAKPEAGEKAAPKKEASPAKKTEKK